MWLLSLLLAASVPARVVSMAPGLTDLVVELGAADRLVGVSRFDDDPTLSKLQRIGGYLDPDLEAVARLAPDLVLALDGVAFAPALRALQSLHLQVLALRTDTLDDVHRSLLALGAALGLPADAAPARWQALSALVDGLRARAAGTPRVRCAIAVGLRPLVLAGRGSYLESLLEAAGGENVSPSPLAWPTSSVEQLVAARPAVLVVETSAALDVRWLALLQAQGTRVVRWPSTDLFLPGPRALRATPALAAALHEKER